MDLEINYFRSLVVSIVYRMNDITHVNTQNDKNDWRIAVNYAVTTIFSVLIIYHNCVNNM